MMEFQYPNYIYRAKVVKVVDGDTIDVVIDLGFNISALKRLRFLDIDTEELRSSDAARRLKALEAKDFVRSALDSSKEVYVQTEMDKTGKYGRVLARVWIKTQDEELQCLNRMLVESGYEKAP